MIIKFRIIQNYQKFEIVESVDHPKSPAELDSKTKKTAEKERGRKNNLKQLNIQVGLRIGRRRRTRP